ncbi:metal ABC transporter permease [Nitratiruptor sp. SB155-2]|uniref:metal ABC transporter permease n=1 Tax=Nitratiruptor sp. (strain SB155-2) TaxID=387092 RepID=UPI0001586E48|nr:metal ABC transporter permease [Nitratiruptor sp. SB155-2]BAF69462.1 Mn2+/Zn2+ ABC transporter, permease [Nitratiruptor sp. SB155-2]
MGEFLEFFSNSVVASLLISIAIATIGSLMLINRYNYLAASIAHGSYGGIGIALYFGTSILFGATVFALALALLLAYISYTHPQRQDISIGVIWAAGMSIGIIFSDLTPGYHVDLLGYLFGDILMVPKSDLWFMLGVDIAATLFVLLFLHQLLLVAYDKEFAILRGIPVKSLHTATLLLIALTIVMSIRSIGLILVIALFSIPPYIAEKYTKNITSMMIMSGCLAFLMMLLGLLAAYYLNISATASIILVASAFYLVTFIKVRQ